MTATTLLKQFEVLPNAGLKRAMFLYPNTTDATNTSPGITLSDFGISATGLLTVSSWVHTADGSVITEESNTCAVAAGVLTITFASGTDNDFRVVEIVGRADTGVFV